MKEMTSVATTMMTEEEKAEIEKELKKQSTTSAIKQDGEGSTKQDSTSAQASASSSGSPKEDVMKELKDRKKKLTPEQRQKLEALEKERHEARMKRVKDLREKLLERYVVTQLYIVLSIQLNQKFSIRPLVDAKHPGDPNDPETKIFEEKIKREAEDLKLESFGVEVWSIISSRSDKKLNVLFMSG